MKGSPAMRKKLLPVCLLLLTAACQPSGFYDSHGNYHSSDTGFEGTSARRTNAGDDKNATDFTFTRPGFYDASGGYVGNNSAFGVSDDFLPPAGMCRVWKSKRALSLQDPAEACRARYNLPDGAYVIYGG